MTVQPLTAIIAAGRLKPMKPRAWIAAACADALQRQARPVTPTALAELSGMSRATVWRACAELRRAGLLHR